MFHVDYDDRSWQTNNVNAAAYQDHPRFTIVPADGQLDNATQDSDLFPTDLNNSLTTASDPRLFFYTGYRIGDRAGIRQVTRGHDNTVSFSYLPLNTTAGIRSLPPARPAAAAAYTLSGIPAGRDRRGARQIVIVKDDDGRTHKEAR